MSLPACPPYTGFTVCLLSLAHPAVLEEKYWATRRELETLRQRIHSEHEDEIEKLQTAKKTLEKKVSVSVGVVLVVWTLPSV